MATDFSGQRVLVTSADRYMGPAISATFAAANADVVADTGRFYPAEELPGLFDPLPDVLVINLAEPPHGAAAEAISDDEWARLFASLVDPMMRLVRAVAGPMKARGSGKIVAVTSAAPLRGIPFKTAYCAARGAQNAFIRAVGVELARYNVQVNAIAQNFVSNNTYYPDDLMQDEKFLAHLDKMVPSKRVAESAETARLALYLADPANHHMVGQIVPLAGGWATTTG